MSPISPIQSQPKSENPVAASGTSTTETFGRLIDFLMDTAHPKNPKAAIDAEEARVEYMRKLAFVSGLVEQAQINMKSVAGTPGGLISQKEADFFFLESKLRQISIPGGNSQVI